MRECTFHPLQGSERDGRRRFVCAECGFTTTMIRDKGLPIHRDCDLQAFGLGDRVSWMLSKVGITKARMKAVFGSCNCDGRQAKLNQFGWELTGRASAAIEWVYSFADIKTHGDAA